MRRADLDWRTSRSGGPGGQHANTSDTRVVLRLDLEAADGLGPRQRARLLGRLGPVVTVTASDTRSQYRNRELALRRLRERLAGALRTVPTRVPTRPPAVSSVRRLETKRRRSETKQQRRRPGPEA